jgi:hypothetical protein
MHSIAIQGIWRKGVRNTANSLPTPGTPSEGELVTLRLPPVPPVFWVMDGQPVVPGVNPDARDHQVRLCVPRARRGPSIVSST